MSKRQPKKLILIENEIAMIKGMIKHTEMNDQMIVAIFSHKSRTINHREIGYFRDARNPKYRDFAVATAEEVTKFLDNYARFERLTKAFGLQPKEDNFALVQKSCEAMKNAVGVYNNPSITWKTEIFIINAIIAWTYLLHAYYMQKGIDYRYRHNDGQLMLTDEGRPKLWELSKCLKNGACPLPLPVSTNLRYLIAIRNEIEHSMLENLDLFLGGEASSVRVKF